MLLLQYCYSILLQLLLLPQKLFKLQSGKYERLTFAKMIWHKMPILLC